MVRIFFLFSWMLVMCIPSFSSAQSYRQPPAVLNVFTKSEPFHLYIDNVLYNDEPSTEVRVEGIRNRTVLLRVEFARRTHKMNIENTVNLLNEEGQSLEVTYTLGRRTANPNLILFSLFPTGDAYQPDFLASGTYQYGNPRVLVHNAIAIGPQPLADMEFASLLQGINNEGFDDGKWKVLQMVAPTVYLSSTQIAEIVKSFSFNDRKLGAAKLLYNNCVDRQNYYTLLEVFPFQSQKDELSSFVINQQKKH